MKIQETSTNHRDSTSVCSFSNNKFGRPELPLTSILKKFNNSNRNRPSSENFCIFLMRAIRKLIKYAKNKRSLNPIGFTVGMSQSQLSSLTNSVRKSLKNYSFNLRTSFANKSNMRNFFNYSKNQEIFQFLIIEMLSHNSIEVLCKRFKITCCLSAAHAESCRDKWEELKTHLQINFIQDLTESNMYEILNLS